MTMRIVSLAVAVSAWLMGSVGFAQAQVIYPVSTTAPYAPNLASPVTVTLSTPNWLPSPNTPVTITVNSGGSPLATQPAISLICPGGTTTPCNDATPAQSNPIAAGTLTTSAYPGVCTNFSGSGTTYSTDFTISGNTLTSLDCGGMAVIRVNVDNVPYTFILPQDSDFDGIPDIWEAKFGPASGAGSLVATADDDNDGLSNFDEYRGVMLSSSPPSQVRLHPKERDLFATLINPGCGETTSYFGGTTGAPAYVPDPNDARSLFSPNLDKAVPATATDPPGPRLHFVNLFGPPSAHGTVTTGEWVDSYSSCVYNAAIDDLDLQFLAAPGTALAGIAPADLDRVITLNAVYDVSESPDASLTASGTGPGTVTLTAGLKVFNQLLAAGNARITLTGGLSGEATITQFIDQTRVTANITRAFPSASIAAGKWRLSTNEQRGIRCVESQNMQVLTTYALATWTTTDATTCTIYSKRIEFRMKNTNTALGQLGLIPKGGTRKLRIQTTSDGGKTWTTTFQEGTDRAEAERRVVAEVMRFYVTMELLHGMKQKPVLGTCTNHDCAGTGYLVDKDFMQVIDSKSSGFNTFRIPTLANSSIVGGVTIRQP